jgi:hypothetical protein
MFVLIVLLVKKAIKIVWKFELTNLLKYKKYLL